MGHRDGAVIWPTGGPWSTDGPLDRPVDRVVERIELVVAEVPLAVAVDWRQGRHERRRLAFLRLIGRELAGTGEVLALAEPGYDGSYLDAELAALSDLVIPALIEELRLPSTWLSALDAVAKSVAGYGPARAAAEAALLDLAGQMGGVSLAGLLGAPPGRVPARATLAGSSRGIEALVAGALACVAAGYQALKLKVWPGFDLVPLRALVGVVPESVAISLDANGSYGETDWRHLARIMEAGATVIEQPLAATDLVGHARLRQHSPVKVALDESITNRSTAAAAIELGAADQLVLKPGRLGGLLEAVRIAGLAVSSGVECAVGGMFESDIGRAANLALAARPEFTAGGDLAGSDRYFGSELTGQVLEVVDGFIDVPAGPGVGRSLDLRALTARQVSARSWSL
jgi:O-succinylbenzoate synthase